MTTAPSDGSHSPPSRRRTPCGPTIRDIRESLPEVQRRHFDAELADTEIEALPEMLHRWVTPSNDGFEEFLLSQPFDGLEFGARSYDARTDAG